MQAEAIAKIKAEMAADKNPYVQFIGDFLLGHLEQHPEDGAKIVNKEKTISKSLFEMRKVAEQKKIDNVAVLTDAEGFAVVLTYFRDDTHTSVPAPAPAKAAKTDKAPAAVPASIPDETDLDDELAAMLL